jgi:hypothetical protein
MHPMADSISAETPYISEADLRSAVAAGAIGERDADRLRAHVEARQSGEAREDERVRVVTGMNDVFIALGVLLLFVPMAVLGGGAVDVDPPFDYALNAAFAAAFWVIAEVVVRRRRTALPGFVLAGGFSYFVVLGGIAAFGGGGSQNILSELTGFHQLGWVGALVAALFLAAVAAFEWRFRLPFCRLFTCLAVLALVMSVLVGSGLSKSLDLKWVAFVFGAALFAAAVWLDSTDVKRVTLRSDQAFWMHVCAAPLMAHPLMSGFGGEAPTVVAFAVFALASIVVDRRAPLVSSLIYLGFWVGNQYETVARTDFNIFVLTFLSLGLLVLALGLGWRTARRLILAPVRGTALAAKLPAVH